jgi:pantoate--beta-alanine ligase
MGALHNGHLSLIEKSVNTCDKTVISIFVNPIQFGASEDLNNYPKTLNADYDLCQKAGVDMVFAPDSSEMYPDGNILSNDFLTYVIPPFFYTDKLCAKSRIGHFDGVCTVVMKLFNILMPDYAFFGQKDAQQLVIIKKMVKDLNIPVEIISCPIVRDAQGLALSSRNQYLTAIGKKDAPVLNKILTNIKACYKKGITDTKVLSETVLSFLNNSMELEYLEFVDKDSLESKEIADENTLVLIAMKIKNEESKEDFSDSNVQVKSVRLIDNCFIS